jgi:hypothetical protein
MIININCKTGMQLFLADNSVDAIVCDPPYELGFMGKTWDSSGIAYDVDMWAECLRVLKPGGHLLAFGGSRTAHRMVCAIEDAGFEVRDSIVWLYGSGFPKSQNVSIAIDKQAGAIGARGARFNAAGDGDSSNGGSTLRSDHPDYVKPQPVTDAARQWEGWGTALKPAHEPICVARKPLIGTVAANVLAHGTGAINIDACRVDTNGEKTGGSGAAKKGTSALGDFAGNGGNETSALGRWPANLIHDGSDEVLAGFPDSNGSGAARTLARGNRDGEGWGMADEPGQLRDAGTGSAARFFYCAKASTAERGSGNNHPTVKPIALMRYLVRLVTPPGGLVLDPFTGSGTTAVAAKLEGAQFMGFELSAEYAAIATARYEATNVDAAVNKGLLLPKFNQAQP